MIYCVYSNIKDSEGNYTLLCKFYSLRDARKFVSENGNCFIEEEE